jgi:hypothetical protein
MNIYIDIYIASERALICVVRQHARGALTHFRERGGERESERERERERES